MSSGVKSSVAFLNEALGLFSNIIRILAVTLNNLSYLENREISIGSASESFVLTTELAVFTLLMVSGVEGEEYCMQSAFE